MSLCDCIAFPFCSEKNYHKFSDYHSLTCPHSFAAYGQKYIHLSMLWTLYRCIYTVCFPLHNGQFPMVTLGKQVYTQFTDQPWVTYYTSYPGQYSVSPLRSVKTTAQFTFSWLIFSKLKWSIAYIALISYFNLGFGFDYALFLVNSSMHLKVCF